jgi:hypothetical protein
MLSGIVTRRGGELKSALCVFVMFAMADAGRAADEWALVVGPSFSDHKMRRPIEGSRRTVVSVCRMVGDELEPLTREQKKSVHMTYDQARNEALKTAARVLAELTPVFVRDRNGVIRHAELRGEHPLTASTVLAPEFGAMFRDTLGPDLLVAMPHRNLVLVFSRQDDAHLLKAEEIIQDYLNAVYPVSREVFALEDGRLRSMGVLQ